MPPIPTVRPDGATIRTLRTSRGWNLKQCAAKAGIAHSALYYYENEQKCPSLGRLERVAAALDVPVQDICKDALPQAERGAA